MARSAEPCELSSSIVVAGDVQRCWDLYVDQTLIAEWAPAVVKLDCAEPVLRLGLTRKSFLRIAGKDGFTVERCDSYETNKYVAFSVLEESFGLAHMLNEYAFSTSFDVDAAGTLMIMKTHYTPKRIFASTMNSVATQQQVVSLMDVALEAFKGYVEVRA